jgi:hypothetical protein
LDNATLLAPDPSGFPTNMVVWQLPSDSLAGASVEAQGTLEIDIQYVAKQDLQTKDWSCLHG